MMNNTRGLYVLIDDERGPAYFDQFDIVAKSAEVGRKVLSGLYSEIDCVCFDHDLGKGENGYELMKWAIEAKILPQRVQLITTNPVGLVNMQRALTAEGYIATSPREYVLKERVVAGSPADIDSNFCDCVRCRHIYNKYLEE